MRGYITSKFSVKNMTGICCILFAAISGFGDSSDQVEKVIKSTKSHKLQQFKEVDKIIADAKKMAAKLQYPEAMALFEKARKKLSAMNGELARFKQKSFNTTFKAFKSRWAGVIMIKARKACVKGRYEEAINIASEVTLVDPDKNDEVVDFIEYCKKMRKAKEFRSRVTLNKFDTSYDADQKKIDLLYREALVLYKNKHYVKVRNRLERVFMIDPYNQKAIHLLDKAYNKLYKYAQERRKTDVDEMFAYNMWQWNEPILPMHMERAIKKSAEVKKTSSSSVYQKLENIIFPNIEFDEADIFSVIRYLNRLSKRYDPDKVGVSIISGFTKKTADALPKVTMSFTKIPMSEVLRYLCQGVGLKYKVDEGAVVIGTNVDEMQTEFFPVRGDLIASITGGAAAAGEGGVEGGGGGGTKNETKTEMKKRDGDFFDTEKTFETEEGKEKKAVSLTSAALIKYFEDRGIRFGDGSTIAYDRRSNKLIVKNTLENLRKLDDLLRQLDLIKTPLVMVEAKIVELTQIDVEELGFDWVFSVPGTNDQDWWINSSNGTTNLQDNPLRFFESVTNPNSSNQSGRNYKVINDLKIFPNFGKSLFGTDTRVNLSLTVDAISQNTKTETLSAPKIITTSGSEATIRMVEETYYPESWEDPDLTVNGSTVELKAPVPEFGDATDIGILFTVKPVVNPDNYTITLHLQPQVVSFVGWTPYPVTMKSGVQNPDGTNNPIIDTTTTILMPEIARRDLDVHIKVYDGETIVLGGMIDNINMNRDDKWPIIGEIPLVGRLFSSQMTYVQQKNLLIFVTTRLINNDGIPVRRNKQRGIPEFYR
jgi:general secretion pathway protein D